jgi:hypothetical protein
MNSHIFFTPATFASSFFRASNPERSMFLKAYALALANPVLHLLMTSANCDATTGASPITAA